MTHSPPPRPVRDLASGGWWWAHRALIDDYAARIGPHGLAVYCALCARANPEQQCWPSISRLARDLGISEPSVRRALDRLVKWKLVHVQGRARSDGSQTSNLYTLLHLMEIDNADEALEEDFDLNIPMEVVDNRGGLSTPYQE